MGVAWRVQPSLGRRAWQVGAKFKKGKKGKKERAAAFEGRVAPKFNVAAAAAANAAVPDFGSQ